MSVYDELVARVERAEERIEELESEVKFLRELLANPHLTASVKSTLWAVRDHIKRNGCKLGQFTDIDMKELGKTTGVSRQTAGDNIMKLAKMGGIARREWKEEVTGRYGRKVFKTHVLVGLSLWTDRPGELEPEKPNNWGGTRVKKCPTCGSEDLVLMKQVYCACCKKEVDSSVKPLNADMSMDDIVERTLQRDKERGQQ